MIKHLLLVLISFLISSQPGFSQEGTNWKICNASDLTKALKAVNEWYSLNRYYSVKISHRVYAGFNSDKIVEQQDGYIIHTPKGYHSYILGVHTIQDNMIKIAVDSAESIMVITNPEKVKDGFPEEILLEELMLICNKFKVHYKATEKVFRLEFSNGRYNSMEITINNKHQLTRLCYFINEKFPLSEPTGSTINENKDLYEVQPKFEIEYSGYSSQINSGAEFTYANYATLRNNKFVPIGKYKNYAIKDLRYKP